jgi:spoIIIJ-associated protein
MGPKYSASATGPRIDEFLRTVLRSGGFELTYEIHDAAPADGELETPELVVKFGGRDVDLLLSNRAELLLALEHATMEMLRMPSDDHSRLSFDANDYRLLRIEELRLSAVTAAEKVKRTGSPFKFNPMNSRERRVIHIALRNETEVRSESLGTGPQRQVIVYPAGMASLPEPPPGMAPPPRPSFGGGGPGRRPGGGPPRRGDGPRRGDRSSGPRSGPRGPRR